MVLNFQLTMKSNYYFYLLISLLFLTAISLQLVQGEDFPAQKHKEQSKVKTERLIRMDLIELINKDFKPPLRNIFTFQPDTEEGLSSLGQEREAVTQRSEISGVNRENQNQLNLFFEYVGYVKSKDKIVALIIFQGTAVAVQEGDLLEDGSVVALVSEESLEVTGTSGQKHTFYLKEEN
ncbi:MAG: hypothetical protein ACOC57_01170 [Acidobacteriota bacterium]